MTHFLCIGGETRNEAENGGFAGEFEDFEETRRHWIDGLMDIWISGLLGVDHLLWVRIRLCLASARENDSLLPNR